MDSPQMHRFQKRTLPLWRALRIAAASLASVLSATAAPYSQRAALSKGYPASYGNWANGLLSGNGRMGIIVFGDP